MSLAAGSYPRGCHGCFLPVVHSVRFVLADRAARASDLSFCLAADTAIAYFWHRRSWSSELDQCVVFSASEAASRATRHLTGPSLTMDYARVNQGNSR